MTEVMRQLSETVDTPKTTSSSFRGEVRERRRRPPLVGMGALRLLVKGPSQPPRATSTDGVKPSTCIASKASMARGVRRERGSGSETPSRGGHAVCYRPPRHNRQSPERKNNNARSVLMIEYRAELANMCWA